MKFKVRPRNGSSLKETKKTWQLNPSHNLGFSFAKRDIIETANEIWIRYIDKK